MAVAGKIHPEDSLPPTHVEAFVDCAANVSATGPDFGVRKRVGFARYGSAALIEVVSFDGDVTKFLPPYLPWVGALSEIDKAALAAYIRRLKP